MNKLPGFIASTTFAVLLFAACGGGDSVQGPTESGQSSPTLDFTPVSGAWAGWGLEAINFPFWIRANLRSRAATGAIVGTIQYGVDGDGKVQVCAGDWRAADAQHPVYTVNEVITEGKGCPNGTVRLELDSQAGTLGYTFKTESGSGEAKGTLKPGTDPGPRP